MKKTASIMLIDRDEISLFVNQHLLRLCGYTGSITPFDNIDEASTYLATETPDIVFMDYFQSYLDGFRLMEQLYTKGIRLVALAEFFSDSYEIEARFVNCRFLRKPLSVEMVKVVLGGLFTN